MLRPLTFILLALALPLHAALDPDHVVQPSLEAAERAVERAQASDPAMPSGATFVAVYAVLIVGGGLALWRFLRRSGPRLSSSSERGIELCRTRPLGNRQYLVVAQVEGHRMLLGVGPGFITHLKDFEADDDARPQAPASPPAVEGIHELPSGGKNPGTQFNALLARINERIARPGEDRKS